MTFAHAGFIDARDCIVDLQKQELAKLCGQELGQNIREFERCL